jgi:adenylate cyclase
VLASHADTVSRSPADHALPEAGRRRAAGGTLEGERKHLTVLFVDVANSLQLAERLGPEAWHEIVDELFQILTEGVHRFDGTVNQYTGDGIMALFGAPIAHEDHAQRACHAARYLGTRLREYGERLRTARGVELAVRMGLNSGEVVFGKIGDEDRLEYTAQGHMVGLAARMEQLARPGHVCLSQHTASLVAGYFALRDLGAFAVKGVTTPVHAFELGDPCTSSTRLEVARARGFSRLIGRGGELAALEDALALARAGRGRIVHVIGDAGIGKSRLCHEFVTRCRRRRISVYEAHCVSHGQAVPFRPILQLLRSCLGIDERTAPGDARTTIRDLVLAHAPALEACLPIGFEFLGIGDPEQPPVRIDPDARQRQLATLLRGIVRARSGKRPAVILIDDVHWIDPGSEGLLLELLSAVRGTHTLLLLNARPGHRLPPVEPDHGGELVLAPLGTQAAGELIDELLGADRSLASLRNLIRERTAGNPFFIEEVVRSLVEAGTLQGGRGGYRLACPAAQVSIPVTVQAVLAARIDRLGDHAKAVLQAAAVIGRTFARSVLGHVLALSDEELDRGLRSLEEATLIHAEPGSSETEFAFHHPLTQEVAYRAQLAAQRVHLHAGVARALENLDSDRLDERAALIAYHWESATEPWHAATWHARAASWTGDMTQAESIRHWRKVRKMLRAVPPSPEVVSLALTACVRTMNLGWRLGLEASEADAVYAEGRALAERLGDTRSLAMLANLYMANLEAGMGHTRRSRARRYREQAREAQRLARATDDVGVRLAVCVNRVYSLYFAGKLGTALAIVDETLADAPADHRIGAEMYLYSPLLWIRSFRGQLLSYMGRPAEAAAALEDAVQAAIAHGELENRGWAEGFWVTQCWAVGDAAAALRHAHAAVEIAETTGSAFSRVLAYKALGVAHALAAAWPAAIETLQRSLEISREATANVLEDGSVLALLAEVHGHAGDLGPARLLADEAVAATRRRHTRMYECQAQIARAAVLVRTEGARGTRAIERALARAWALVEDTGARAYAPVIHECRAALARLRGDEGRWRRELEAARREFGSHGATGHLRRLDNGQSTATGEVRA